MRFLGISLIILLVFAGALAQQTNPVDRQVSNPITDTPNINPVSPQQSVALPKLRKKPALPPEGGDGELIVYSDHQTVQGEAGKRILHHSGNVDVRYGIFRMQADDIIIFEEDHRVVAKGSVIFDEGDDQRITGATAEWNYKTKLGWFEDATGFTNQSVDGTVLYFSADRVERVDEDDLIVTNGKFTACDEAVPKWSFTAERAKIRVHDRLSLKNARFRIKDIPVAILPGASLPLKALGRSSGFLLPTIGFSGSKGLHVSTAYYLTLGRSADLTLRGDIYTSRGIGYGMDLRTRANSRSYFNGGFFKVQDRILGHKKDAAHSDQGGSMVYAEGVHFFPHGWTAAVDYRQTSSLAFRQAFSEGVQQIISPIEVSQVSLSKSFGDYTFNALARQQVISIPNIRERTRAMPMFTFEKRPSMPSFLKGVYFSFLGSGGGVSRHEDVDDLTLYKSNAGSDPVNTKGLMFRFDIYPQLMVPIHTKYVNFTATGSARVTHYSNSFDDMRRLSGETLTRKYGSFTFDVRPVAFAKNYYGKDDSFKFRHVIEPFATYRYVRGIDNFNKIIRFDYVDTMTDTNEIEFGVTNRFFTRKYTEAVTPAAKRLLKYARGLPLTTDDTYSLTNTDADSDGAASANSNTKSGQMQPYEVFTVTVREKYFVDKTFGGALIPGRRNEIEPITALSFYTFGGVPRRFSPINIDATYRPQRTFFINARMDYGVQGGGIRDLSSTVGFDSSLVKFFQTFYYTRAVTLIPSLAQYADPKTGKEVGTLRGSQWSPSIFVGDRGHGFYGGASFFFDFENRKVTHGSPMISSLFTLGYAYDCCALAVQYSTFNVGVRHENRFTFSFRLNGIGTFGTEQPGFGLR